MGQRMDQHGILRSFYHARARALYWEGFLSFLFPEDSESGEGCPVVLWPPHAPTQPLSAAGDSREVIVGSGGPFARWCPFGK